MSLVWIILTLGVSLLTIAVAFQLLEEESGKLSGRLVAPAVGMLLLIEGIAILFTSLKNWNDFGQTTAIHAVGLIVAGAGIWSIGYRALRVRVAATRWRER